ncbi:MAG TPA: hypothetical protein VF444_13830 [Pseudonocardiaceae bacterium]
MTNAIDAIPDEKYRAVIIEILGERAPELLASLRTHEKPTLKEQDEVIDVLADAFTEHFGPGHEPTERGVLIDNALGAFLTRWPTEIIEAE